MDVPKRIEVEDGLRVVLTWEDNTTTELNAARIRAACQCATCREPQGAAKVAALLDTPDQIVIAEAKLVGGYAVNFIFGPDGHGTGIYSFDALRELGSEASPAKS